MTPDFLSLPDTASVAEALEAVRRSTAPPEALTVVFARDVGGSVTGSASMVALVKADPADMLAAVVTPIPAHVHPDWDIGAVVRKMSDFNLAVAPVMDPEHQHVLGVVTVDDVLELLLPTGWRRDFGTTAPEE